MNKNKSSELCKAPKTKLNIFLFKEDTVEFVNKATLDKLKKDTRNDDVDIYFAEPQKVTPSWTKTFLTIL